MLVKRGTRLGGVSQGPGPEQALRVPSGEWMHVAHPDE